MTDRKAHMPTDVRGQLGVFDRFATRASHFASKAWFFAGCVAVVVIWVPSYLVVRNVNTWQLLINSATTIVTFLMVALLHNTQTRNEEAINDKLNAIAEGLADLMDALNARAPALRKDEEELRSAVGLEDRESA